jgi:5-methylcytosine-specific restriction enzyme A
MGELEERFESEMIERVFRTTGKETGYWASYFLRSVRRYGGVEAARRLLGRKTVSAGFTKLREKNRLDLSMESVVLRPEYHDLFTDEERAIAVSRLDEAAAPAEVAGP